MNENSQPKTPVISEWLAYATTQLKAVGIQSARLDAELILSHTLRKSRTYLHAHIGDSLDSRQYEIADARLALRLERTPVAYIIGHKEFYGRTFKVTPATLIPRPESEDIITLLKKIAKNLPSDCTIVDVGAGSGCLGITAKLELPASHVTLLDISHHALKVAETNAKSLKADVHSIYSNLLHEYPLNADVIIANLPYVDKNWERSPETNYEPALALFAQKEGLSLIESLIEQAPHHVTPKGHLLIEADPQQHSHIIKDAEKHHFKLIEVMDYIIHLQSP